MATGTLTGSSQGRPVRGESRDDGAELVRPRSPDGQLERGRLPGGGAEDVAGCPSLGAPARPPQVLPAFEYPKPPF